MLKFHAIGDWTADQIEIRQVPSTRQIMPVVEASIETIWQQVAGRKGVNLFDGPMCRLESWHAEAHRLQLTLSETSYKPFLGTNLHQPHLADQYGNQILANPVGMSPALETADGWLMMGRRNATVAYYPEKVHPFAGALEPKDAHDVMAGVQRELAEELGFTAADVKLIRCTGIAEDISIRQPELIFRVETYRTKDEIEQSLDHTEHRSTWAVRTDKNEIAAVLKNPHELTPIAVAALVLWGRVKFGQEWFHFPC